jgi:hypothetical protein
LLPIGGLNPVLYTKNGTSTAFQIGEIFVSVTNSGVPSYTFIFSLRKTAGGVIAPADAFSTIKFTDKNGIARQLPVTNLTSVRPWGTRAWYYDVPSDMFTSGNQYIILVE